MLPVGEQLNWGILREVKEKGALVHWPCPQPSALSTGSFASPLKTVRWSGLDLCLAIYPLFHSSFLSPHPSWGFRLCSAHVIASLRPRSLHLSQRHHPFLPAWAGASSFLSQWFPDVTTSSGFTEPSYFGLTLNFFFFKATSGYKRIYTFGRKYEKSKKV